MLYEKQGRKCERKGRRERERDLSNRKRAGERSIDDSLREASIKRAKAS